jgi:hypothetical protein
MGIIELTVDTNWVSFQPSNGRHLRRPLSAPPRSTPSVTSTTSSANVDQLLLASTIVSRLRCRRSPRPLRTNRGNRGEKEASWTDLHYSAHFQGADCNLSTGCGAARWWWGYLVAASGPASSPRQRYTLANRIQDRRWTFWTIFGTAIWQFLCSRTVFDTHVEFKD